jgi:hypothetical protein
MSDMKTLTGSISMLHVATGVFLNVAGGHQDDHPLWGDIQMWHLRGGLSRNFFGMGNTAVYAEYADHQLKTANVDSDFWGLGIVQSIDAAALDAFVSYRSYDIGGGLDASVGMAGVRIKF